MPFINPAKDQNYMTCCFEYMKSPHNSWLNQFIKLTQTGFSWDALVPEILDTGKSLRPFTLAKICGLSLVVCRQSIYTWPSRDGNEPSLARFRSRAECRTVHPGTETSWVQDSAFTLGLAGTETSRTWLGSGVGLSAACIPRYVICCPEHWAVVWTLAAFGAMMTSNFRFKSGPDHRFYVNAPARGQPEPSRVERGPGPVVV